MNRWLWLLILGLTLVAPKMQAQTVNGTLVGDESFYGTALSVQDTQTQFGDADTGDPSNPGGGSEIDQVFGKVSGGRLHVLITGNLEANFNKLDIYFDSVSGGQNALNGASLPAGVDAFCCGGGGGGGFPAPKGNSSNFGALQGSNGLTFDAGFDADYFLTFTNGFEKVNPGLGDQLEFWAFTAHYADLTDGTSGDVVRVGMALAPQGQPNVQRAVGEGLSDFPHAPFNPAGGSPTMIGPALPGLGTGELIDRTYAQSVDGGCTDDTGAGCVAGELEFVLDVDPTEIGVGSLNNASSHRFFENSIDLKAAIDNSNTEGVSGGGADPFELGPTDDPENVATGIEFSIPLSALGDPSGDIKITAFVNNGDHNFASNQFAGDGIFGVEEPEDISNANPGAELFGGFFTLADYLGDQFVTVSQSAAGVTGDYNGNGVVDAADYTVWLDALGGTVLLNDNTPGTVDASDYTFWKANFGATTGAANGGAVPEPASLLLLCLAALGVGAIRRR